MSYLEKLKEIYSSIKPEMSYCTFAPNLDADKWEAGLNKFAPQEEPISVLCIGEASVKGVLSFLSASSFLLTNKKLYMENIKGCMKFAEIASISYYEEEKKVVFGKSKIEGFITIEKTNGEKETLKGNYATKEIAEFLNKSISELKNNPPQIPYKDSQNVSKIADIIKANIKGDKKYWKIVPDITDKEITSFIIHFAKDEMKVCFAAIYEDYSGEKLYFTNDCLYYKKSDKLNKFNYGNLSNASYFEKRKKEDNGNLVFSQNVILYDKNKEVIFETSNAEKNLADIFNNIISLITGKDIKTEVHKEKDVFFTLLEKWDEFFSSINTSEPISIQNTEQEVFADERQYLSQKMPVYLCKTVNNYEFNYAEKWISIRTIDENIYKQYGRLEHCKSSLRCLYYKFSKKEIIFSMHFYLLTVNTANCTDNYRIKLECSLLEEPVYIELGLPWYNTSAAEFTKKRMKEMNLEGLWEKIDSLTNYLRHTQNEKKKQEEVELKQEMTKKNNEALSKLAEI